MSRYTWKPTPRRAQCRSRELFRCSACSLDGYPLASPSMPQRDRSYPLASIGKRKAWTWSVALRFGRKPYEHERKSASKIGSSTSRVAACTTRSRIVGMPRGRCFPSAFGMYRRRTAAGRSLPARRTSPLHTRSYSAWKRLPGCRLATDHSRRWSSRTLSTGLRPRGKLGPVLPAMPSRLPPSTAPSPQGPFPPVALFVAALTGTTVPSDSRCTRRDFAFGLYAPRCPDVGRADGSLLFPIEP